MKAFRSSFSRGHRSGKKRIWRVGLPRRQCQPCLYLSILLLCAEAPLSVLTHYTTSVKSTQVAPVDQNRMQHLPPLRPGDGAPTTIRNDRLAAQACPRTLPQEWLQSRAYQSSQLPTLVTYKTPGPAATAAFAYWTTFYFPLHRTYSRAPLV